MTWTMSFSPLEIKNDGLYERIVMMGRDVGEIIACYDNVVDFVLKNLYA